jgi:hypothetical protein
VAAVDPASTFHFKIISYKLVNLCDKVDTYRYKNISENDTRGLNFNSKI